MTGELDPDPDAELRVLRVDPRRGWCYHCRMDHDDGIQVVLTQDPDTVDWLIPATGCF